MNLGAEQKKIAILGGLVVIGAIAYYMNSSGDSTETPAPRVAPASLPKTVSMASAGANASSGAARKRSFGNAEFRPVVGGTRPEDTIDPASIDPQLKLELLAKVQAVEPIEAGRNLFQFGTAPPKEKPLPPVPPAPQKIDVSKKPDPPPPPPPDGASGSQTVTQSAPINLKYFGYKFNDADGRKVAYLMDGDQPVLVEENQVVKQRYRIVRISQKSIVIEDTQSKSTQTLQLQDITPA